MRVRNLFMRDIATGAEFELGEIKEIEIVPADPDECCVSTTLPSLTGTFEVSLDVFLQPKTKIVLFGLTNNYIRLHGGRPMRKIPRRFL